MEEFVWETSCKKKEAETEKEGGWCRRENKLSWKIQERRLEGREKEGRRGGTSLRTKETSRVRCPFLISKWHCYSQGSGGDRLIGRRRGRRHRIDCRSPRDSQTFLSPTFSVLSIRPPCTQDSLCPTGRFEAEAHKESPRLSISPRISNQETREYSFALAMKVNMDESRVQKLIKWHLYNLQDKIEKNILDFEKL